MSRNRIIIVVIAALIFALSAAYALLPVNIPVTGLLGSASVAFEQDSEIQGRLTLPPGYSIGIFATGIDDARFMQITPTGDILVTNKGDGQLVLVKRDEDGDGRSDGVEVLVENLNTPHGIWLEDTALYIGEEHQIVRYRYYPQSRKISGKTVILADIPDDGGHSTRTIRKGPDGWFYVSVGSSCNVCVEEHPWRAAIVRFREPGDTPEIFAAGLRNTVGFDWQPGTGRLYGVENSRDWLGDDYPPDEMNLIEKNKHYGWPYFNGDNEPDEDRGQDAAAQTITPVPPAHAFNAHVAPLGITFLKNQAGTDLEGAAMVAQHGSWNRSVKIGYRVVALHWSDTGEITQSSFIEGFEQDGDVIGRPVDVAEAPDGTLYISDDYAGVIYRVVRK